MIEFEEVLEDKVRDLEQLVEALSIKLMERDTELYTQISKTISIEDNYLELVRQMELHRKEARLLVRQLECLHSDVVLGGLCKIEAGVEMLKSDLSEEMK